MRIMQSITDYIVKSILTTQGDMVVRGATLPEALVAVAVGQVLKSGGVGTIPAWGVPAIANMGMESGEFVRSTADDEVVSGLSITPGLVIFCCRDSTGSNGNMSIGFDNGTHHIFAGMTNDGQDAGADAYNSIFISRAGSNFITGYITAMASGTFTVTFALTGTASVNVKWLAIG